MITTGAAALRDGDRILLPGAGRAGARGGAGGARGAGRQAAGAGPGRRRGRPAEPAPLAPAAAGTDPAEPSRRIRRVESAGAPMSIPRTAIRRPVTMFMICCGHHPARRDLADAPAGRPDAGRHAIPSITVRVSYSGVGPLEMEELVTRPIEQAVSAVAGLEQINVDLVGRLEHGPAELRVGHRPERGGRRRAHARSTACAAGCRRTPTRRPSSSSTPRRCRSWASASRATTTRSRCARWPSASSRPRLERVPGVAAVTVSGGLRRQIHVELSKEKIAALDLSVDRIVSLLRTREPEHPARRDRRRRHDLPAPQPGAVRRTSTRSGTWWW